MKLVGIACAGMLAAAGVGGAHAQSACGQIVQLGLSNHAQVKAMRGEVLSQDNKEIQYRFKPGITGFETCTIRSAIAIDDIGDYWMHHLWCEAEAATPELATKAVESLWSCTKDAYTERTSAEAWLDEDYRVIAFTGEVTAGGRESGPVEFGDVDYARVEIEKAFDTSEEYALHVYWRFLK